MFGFSWWVYFGSPNGIINGSNDMMGDEGMMIDCLCSLRFVVVVQCTEIGMFDG